MSMINDALRRASSAAKSTPVAPPSDSVMAPPPPPLPPMPVEQSTPLPPAPPMPNAVTPPPPLFSGQDGSAAPPLLRVGPTRNKSMLPIILIVLFVFCLAGAAGIYLWQKARLTVAAVEKADEEPTDGEFVAALLGDEKARAKIAGAIDYTNAPAPAPTAPPPVAKPTPVVAATTPTIPAPAPASNAPRVPVKFPPLRLQSIFYRPSNPSVIINGKTLFVADEINGVLVADIQPANVTLVLSGQTNVLTLR